MIRNVPLVLESRLRVCNSVSVGCSPFVSVLCPSENRFCVWFRGASSMGRRDPLVRESLRVVFSWAVFPFVWSRNVVFHGGFGFFGRGGGRGVLMGFSLLVFSHLGIWCRVLVCAEWYRVFLEGPRFSS